MYRLNFLPKQAKTWWFLKHLKKHLVNLKKKLSPYINVNCNASSRMNASSYMNVDDKPNK